MTGIQTHVDRNATDLSVAPSLLPDVTRDRRNVAWYPSLAFSPVVFQLRILALNVVLVGVRREHMELVGE